MAATGAEAQTGHPRTDPVELDVVVVGAGFAGLHLLRELRDAGFSVQVIEAGTGVGGTWFWNRYPGARCDVESIDYSYSFSEELQQEWDWTERYAAQPELLRYLDHVADRFDLRRDIHLSTRVRSAVLGDAGWELETTDGRRFHATYCVMATGPLSSVKRPDFPGLDDFRGEWHHTARWPEGGVDFTGRRVAVVGTGSTGIQAIPVIAEEAEQLFVLQRTPNFSVPARNHPLAAEQLAAVKAQYAARRALARRAPSGVPSEGVLAPGTDVPLAERLEAYERGWQRGGASAVLRTYSDMMTEPEVNESMAEFVRGKIRATVEDPEVAERLLPRGFPIGAKRLCVDSNYYETFNRSNVTLVDVREAPIERITENGIRLADGREIEVDVIVFAIGFDAITGALGELDVRGRDGLELAAKWRSSPQAFLGLAVAGFPNLFLVNGPGSPAVLGNVVTFIEHHVRWITACLQELRRRGFARIEADAQAEDAWVAHVDEVAHATLYPKARSWFTGENVEGKKVRFLPFAGGFERYAAECEAFVAADYEGFAIDEDGAERRSNATIEAR